MSQWDKLIADILRKDKNLRFDDLAKALVKIGYAINQPRKGSSHYKFSKPGKEHITIPKQIPISKVYIDMVRDAVIEYESEKENESGD